MTLRSAFLAAMLLILAAPLAAEGVEVAPAGGVIAGGQEAPAPGQTATSELAAYVRGLDATSARGLWPGFDPSRWPIAVFDGERTLLFRHPSPPPEFAPVPGQPGVLAMPGQYPAVVANSGRDIGGVRTATIVQRSGQATPNIKLGVLEEVFHLFWLSRHAGFRPNEMARYGYPLEDAAIMRAILAEDEALARAVEAGSAEDAAAWAGAALAIRRQRHELLDDELRTFETALEMLEGTANWFAQAALAEPPVATTERLRRAWPAERIRWRFYASGTAMCWLLHRLRPGWQITLDRELDRSIVDLLGDAVAASGVMAAAFSPADLAAIEARATRSIADLAARRARLREELAGRTGARIVVDVRSGAERLSIERFDPINLFVLGGGDVVHPAFVALTVADGRIEITNPAPVRGEFTAGTIAVTSSGSHYPLAGSFHTVTVVGIRGVPRVTTGEGRVTIEAEGVKISLAGAAVTREGETLRVTLTGPKAAA